MSTWSVQDAKAKFSALLDACKADGPQFVTRRGAEIAVVTSLEEWRRLQAGQRPSLKELLLRDDGRTDALAAADATTRLVYSIIADPVLCLIVFKSNRDAGLVLFAGLLLDSAVNRLA